MKKTAHSIVTVSFQSDSSANQSVHEALTGVKQGTGGSGPFRKPGTACFMASGENLDSILHSLMGVVEAAIVNAESLDSLVISMSVDRP